MDVTRVLEVAWGEIRKIVPKVWSIAKELFHEIMGFVFLALCVFFTVGQQGLIRTIGALDEDPEAMPRLLLVAAFVIMFLVFGISSFRRARRISRGRQ